METILQFSIIAIPIIIGVVSGINKKLGTENKYVKEATTVIISAVSVWYYVAFVKSLEVELLAVMFVINYFGASGIYQFIPSHQDGVVNSVDTTDVETIGTLEDGTEIIEINDENLEKEFGE